MQVVLYIDDGIDAEDNFADAARASVMIQKDLVLSGWVPHATKCIWVSTQILPWLGNYWNLVSFTLYATEERILRAKVVLDSI